MESIALDVLRKRMIHTLGLPWGTSWRQTLKMYTSPNNPFWLYNTIAAKYNPYSVARRDYRLVVCTRATIAVHWHAIKYYYCRSAGPVCSHSLGTVSWCIQHTVACNCGQTNSLSAYSDRSPYSATHAFPLFYTPTHQQISYSTIVYQQH